MVVRTILMPAAAAGLGVALLAGCSSIGPATVPHDRIDYANAIGDSWKAQTLLNIVKLRYADVPIFLEPTQVIAGYQLQSTLAGNVAFGNFNAAQIGPFTVNGGVAAGGSYTDRPTVIYSPLTGTDFLKRLLTPIPPSSVLFLLQAGYSAERVMAVMLDSINGLDNRSIRLARRADPQYTRLVELIREAQLAGALQFRLERAKEKDGPESALFVFGPNPDPELAAKGREIRKLLGLKLDLQRINVYYGGHSGKDDEIDMATRSMLQIMLEFSAFVEVPEADVAGGKAVPIPPDMQAMPSLMRIQSGAEKPADAFVAAEYGGRWFWIADADIRSKSMFGAIILLFSVADTGIKGSAPVVTVPAQ
jgi:hypothetical protein